jgi:DNA polymerase-3 subunit delta'
MPGPRSTLTQLAATQPRAVHTLARGLTGGRLPHGVLVLGARNTPVAAMGEALAQRLCCTAPRGQLPSSSGQEGIPGAGPDACGACAGCLAYAHGRHPSVLHIRPSDKDSIGIAEVRQLRGRISLQPGQGAMHVVVVESACSMAPPAQNALLKTLEEPPGPACIILCAYRRQRLLGTILSRVLRLTLVGTPHADAVAALCRGGIPELPAQHLAPSVGADVAAAQTRLDDGFVEVVDTVRHALGIGLAAHTLQRVASDLGSTPVRYQMAQDVLEVLVRDALAQQGGAAIGGLLLSHATSPLAHAPAATLAAGIDALVRLRSLHHLPINRAQALEGLLLTLNHPGTL